MQRTSGEFLYGLDAVSFQFPTEPGQTTRMGASVGGFGKWTDYQCHFEPGLYRIRLQDTQTKEFYYIPYTVVKGEVFADPSRFSMSIERPAYDCNIDEILYSFVNNTDHEAGYGIGESLEYLKDGEWKRVKEHPVEGEKRHPSIGCALFSHSSSGGTLELMWYEQPLKPGRYRILKGIGDELLGAEFTILDPIDCLGVPEPRWAEITLPLDGKDCTFSIGPEEYSDRVNSLRHELLAFQRGTKPQGLPITPAASLKLTTANRRIREHALWQVDGRIWTSLEGQWYYSEDPGILTRLQELGKEMGAHLPSTGEELLAALKALPPLKSVQFSPHNFTTPYVYSGWQSDLQDSGITLSIFQFPSAEKLNKYMRYLSNNGYTVGTEQLKDGYAAFQYDTYQWVNPPHYFTAGTRLVLYNGSDAAILSALTGLLGAEITPSAY